MRKILQKIYRQPKEVRDGYALIIASVFTALVCTVWVTAKLQAPVDSVEVAEDSTSPFATLLSSTKEQFTDVLAVVNDKPVTDGEDVVATTTVSTNAATLVLSTENKDALAAKSTSTATGTEDVSFKEVLIGTTSASTTAQ